MKGKKAKDKRSSGKGSEEQRIKAGQSFVARARGNEIYLTQKQASKRNPSNMRMKRLGPYLIPRGHGYRHESELNHPPSAFYLHYLH